MTIALMALSIGVLAATATDAVTGILTLAYFVAANAGSNLLILSKTGDVDIAAIARFGIYFAFMIGIGFSLMQTCSSSDGACHSVRSR